MARKYGEKASKKVESAMRRRKRGTLRSGGSGKKVKSRKQAIAIGLSEARQSDAKVPPQKKKKKSAAKKKGRKKGTRKKGGSRKKTRKKGTRKKGGQRKKRR